MPNPDDFNTMRNLFMTNNINIPPQTFNEQSKIEFGKSVFEDQPIEEAQIPNEQIMNPINTQMPDPNDFNTIQNLFATQKLDLPLPQSNVESG